MKKQYITGIILCILPFIQVKSQEFENYFKEKTLRIDYIFSGNTQQQHISVDELLQFPQWNGRRHRLNELPLAGNGEITMKNKETGKIIYRHSFSSLFQEWITEKEAASSTKAFENSFLLPFPINPVEITIELKDVHQQVSASLTHIVTPDDILIRRIGEKDISPYRYLHKGENPDKCIDVAIVAEGYTSDEMETFYADAQIACEAIFEHAPFDKLKHHFNMIAVGVPSKESGVSIPREGVWKETAISSNFDTFYSQRYLTTSKVKQLNNVLAGIPYEHIIVLANTDTYGGGGIYNSYTLTTAHHPKFRPVVVHEFGHSFGGLADEYFYDDMFSTMYPSDIEPWEQNITTLVNFDAKWKDMLPCGIQIPTPPVTDPEKMFTEIGVYEGAGYSSKGIYRPATECRMKINEAPVFCPACQRALERLIRFYTNE